MAKTIIELFSGSKIMSNEFKKKGYTVFTIDNNPKLTPDLCINILDFDISMLPNEFKNPFVVWASPPCTAFSIAAVYSYWFNSRPKSYKTFIGLAIAKKTVEIIKELSPVFWFIENPRGMLRKQYFMREFPRKTLTYCQYGHKARKVTDIWTNAVNWIPKKKCNNGDNCHEEARRGTGRGVQDVLTIDGFTRAETRAIIPRQLCKEIVKVCENDLTIRQMVLKW